MMAGERKRTMHRRCKIAAVLLLAASLWLPGGTSLAGGEDDFLAGRSKACPNCALERAALKRRDLADADLSGANLAGAVLHRARLLRAKLAGANLADSRTPRSRGRSSNGRCCTSPT
jgi:Pentapeptide repeats (8 copies)